ncbi:MAG: NADH-quinone oxidoreductase subunit N [Anaerolineales bacterium]|nr:NADH-quinone oxidoreductase subunit N [Anaerolineales bacterium]
MTLLPEILLLLLALVILGLDLIPPEKRRASLGWLTAAGLGGILAAHLLGGAASASGPATVHADALAFFFRALFLLGAMITVLISIDSEGVGRHGEYYALLLFSTIGLCLMAAAADLIMLALAIEMAAMPLYILAGFLNRNSRSTEAGVKYFLFGATASAVMWYGFSLLYGFTGQTDLSAAAVALAEADPAVILAAAVPILAGLGFKVAMVPFHFWAPDVYEGAPTPVAAFLSTAVKAAGFAVLLRILLAVFPPASASYWGLLISLLSAVTMTLGNLLAMVQKNIKRLLAYSSIAHAGYALIGLVTLLPEGLAATAFYLLTYLFANLAAFAVVTLVANAAGGDDVSALAGLSRRSPAAALAMLVALLSLAGMPPLAGFAGKVFLFASAVEARLIWLAAFGAANSVLALYYYLTVIKSVYLHRGEHEQAAFPFPGAAALALAACTAGILVLGIAASPWFEAALRAVRPLFPG